MPMAGVDMSNRTLPHILALTALALTALLTFAASASAKAYTDVKKSHWAYESISSVTDRAVQGHRLLDDYEKLFRPERAITRELLARSVALASGHYGRKYEPIEIKDVPKGSTRTATSGPPTRSPPPPPRR
jgi:hypothetical protein